MSKHSLPLSVSFPPLGKMNSADGLRMVAEHGFDSMDFNVNNIVEYFDDWREETYRAKEALERSNLIVVSGHLPFRGGDDLHKRILRGIEVAGILGLKKGVLHPIGSRTADDTAEARRRWFEKNIEYYNTYLPYAEKAGITLVTENMRDPLHDQGKHRYASNADELIELADTLGLEICWDFGHANEAGLDQYTEIKKLGSRLTMTHVNDNWGAHDEHIPPFYGQTDWDGAMRALGEIGYSNPLNFELKFKKLPREIWPEALNLVRRIGEVLLDKIDVARE